jgi:hypothetical protein
MPWEFKTKATDHLGGQGRDEIAKEGANRDAKLFANVARSPTQNTTQHVSPADVARDSTVADGECQGPDVIGDDSVGGVNPVNVVLAELAGVWPSVGELPNSCEEGYEDVRVVVGALVLENGDKAFETHAGVDVLSREGAEGGVGFAVVLNEDEVPDLDEGKS